VGVLVLFAWAVVASALPDAVPGWLGLDRHAPDLFVALAVWLGTRTANPGAVGWAALLGAAKDAVSLDPLGTHAFTLGFVAWAFLRRSGGPAPRGLALALCVAGGALLGHATLVLRSMPVARDGPGLEALAAAPAIALWTALWSAPALALLDRTRALDDLVGRRGGLPA
jgi:hypothetical protein